MKWCSLILVLLLSGCGAYHQTTTTHPQYAAVNKGQIEYYRLGKGSPVILIAGYATDITSWDRDFLAALAQKHELIIFNNRNVAGSHIHSAAYHVKDLADDTSALINALNLKNVTVVGISMGGMIAQKVAVQHPDKLSSLVLINTAIAGSQSIHPDATIEKKMLNMPVSKLGRYSLALNTFFPPSWRIQMAYSLAFNRFLPDEYEEIVPATILPYQRRLITAWTNDNKTAAGLKKLKMPVLILNGEADQVIPPVNSVILSKAIKHSHLVRWKDGGHAMIYQYPKEMAAVINQFI